MISTLVFLGILMGLTLPMAIGYVGLVAMAVVGIAYGAIYALIHGVYRLTQKETINVPWFYKQDKAS